MPTVPTPEELGSLPHVPGSRPIGAYDLSSYASGAREIADAGARFGQAIADIGNATYKIGRQQAVTEAVNKNTLLKKVIQLNSLGAIGLAGAGIRSQDQDDQ